MEVFLWVQLVQKAVRSPLSVQDYLTREVSLDRPLQDRHMLKQGDSEPSQNIQFLNLFSE